jgi:hypothetical protein
VNKFISTAGLIVVGLVVVTAATPALTKLAHALAPLIVTAGVVAAVLRIVWTATRRW